MPFPTPDMFVSTCVGLEQDIVSISCSRPTHRRTQVHLKIKMAVQTCVANQAMVTTRVHVAAPIPYSEQPTHTNTYVRHICQLMR